MTFPKIAPDKLGRACFAYGETFDPTTLPGAQLVVTNSLNGQKRARGSFSGLIARYRFPHVTTFDEDAALRATLPDAAYLHATTGGRATAPTWTWTDPSAQEWRDALRQYVTNRIAEGATAIYFDGSIDLPLDVNAEPRAYFADRGTQLIAYARDPQIPILVNGAMAVGLDANGRMQDGCDGRALILPGEAIAWVADGLLAEDVFVEDNGKGTGPLILGDRWRAGQNAILGMQDRHPGCSIVTLSKTETWGSDAATMDRAAFVNLSWLLSKNSRSMHAVQPRTDQPRKSTSLPYLGSPSQDAWRIDDLRQADGTYLRAFKNGRVRVDIVKGEGWIES